MTLGTSRRPPGPDVAQYLELRDAVDPSAGNAEKALAAYALTERLERLRFERTDAPAPATATAEDLPVAGGQLGQALKLTFSDTYAALLPEVLQLLVDKGKLLPPYLLPKLLDYAAGLQLRQPATASVALLAGGKRAKWLAAQHPTWQVLHGNFDHATAYLRAGSPSEKSTILQRWRADDPAAARSALAAEWAALSPKNQVTLVGALSTGLGEEDTEFLQAGLKPKRKAVRRALTSLLLRAGDRVTMDEMIELAALSIDDRGAVVSVVRSAEGQDILKRFGGLKAKETIAEFLLANLPPDALPDLLGRERLDFWSGLTRKELLAAATALHNFGPSPAREEFIRYALTTRRDKLPIRTLLLMVESMSPRQFEGLFHQYLDEEQEGFRSGSVAADLVVASRSPWSERISKAFVLALVDRLQGNVALGYAGTRDQATAWELATPRLAVGIFPWLRQQLHAMTERPDVLGRRAVAMLQTTAFRRRLYADPR